MKKVILLLALFFTLSIPVKAEDEPVPVQIYRERELTGNKDWERSIICVPVEVYFDAEKHIVKVVGEETADVEIFIYNGTGVMVDYSSTINTEFILTSTGKYTIIIQGEGWYGEAIISVI